MIKNKIFKIILIVVLLSISNLGGFSNITDFFIRPAYSVVVPDSSHYNNPYTSSYYEDLLYKRNPYYNNPYYNIDPYVINPYVNSSENSEESGGFFSVVGDIFHTITGVFKIIDVIEKVANGIKMFFVNLITEGPFKLIEILVFLLYKFLSYINYQIVAPLADIFLSLDPFFKKDQNSQNAAEQIWFILKTFSYLILVFSALFAGFQWILGEDNNAKSLIFTIIIVAFLIDFTFLFVKEAFYVVRAIEKGLAGDVTIVDPADPNSTRKDKDFEVGNTAKLIAVAASNYGRSPIDLRSAFNRLKNYFTLSTSSEIDGFLINTDVIVNILIRILILLNYIITTMIIFIVLVVMMAIGLARYLILIFLASVSSFAVVSLAFPKFKPPFNAVTGMVSDVFSNWLKHLVNWLLVVPVLTILIILGIIVQNTIFTSNFSQGGNVLVDFLLPFLIIIGWFIMSLYIAVQMSGRVGEIAKGVAVGALSVAGLTAVGIIGKGLAGSTSKWLGKIAGGLGKLSGPSWLGRKFYKASQRYSAIAEDLKKRAYGETAQNIGDQLKDAYSLLGKAKNNEEKEQAANKIFELLNTMKQRPELASLNKDTIKQVSGFTLRQIADNKELLQNFLGIFSEFDTETQEGIISKLDSNSTKKILEHMQDKNFAQSIGSLSPVLLDGLGKNIANLNPGDILKIIRDDTIRENLSAENLQPLVNSINKATKGLYEGFVRKSVEKVAEALANLPSEVFKEGGDLFEFLQKNDTLKNNFNTIFHEVMTRNRREFAEGFAKASTNQKNIMVNNLNSYFRSNPEVLRSMVSEDDLSLLAQFLAHRDADVVTINAYLTDNQREKLNLSKPLIEKADFTEQFLEALKAQRQQQQ